MNIRFGFLKSNAEHKEQFTDCTVGALGLYTVKLIVERQI